MRHKTINMAPPRASLPFGEGDLSCELSFFDLGGADYLKNRYRLTYHSSRDESTRMYGDKHEL